MRRFRLRNGVQADALITPPKSPVSRVPWLRDGERWLSLTSIWSMARDEAVGYGSVSIEPHDLTVRIDSNGGGFGGARHIDSGEGTAVQQKAVGQESESGILPHDLTPSL